jgi:hypothetical protein
VFYPQETLAPLAVNGSTERKKILRKTAPVRDFLFDWPADLLQDGPGSKRFTEERAAGNETNSER